MNIGLLSRALTHRSYMNEHKDAVEDNERLEFLGDAVLDFLVGAWLYNRFPEMAEGQLTRLRAALVGNQELADFARMLEIGMAMRLGRGEAENGGRDRPALLGATFEAIVGALYLDSGMQPVRAFVEPYWRLQFRKLWRLALTTMRKVYFRNGHRLKDMAPRFIARCQSGPDHDKCFIVEVLINGQECGRGSGHSKQSASEGCRTGRA